MPDDAIKPSEWQKLYEWVQTLIGHSVPRYVAVPLGYLVLIALILVVILVIFIAVLKIKENYDKSLGPWLYPAELRQKTKIRQRFAKYLLQEIISRNLTENWRDEEFTELEAEVEAEGSRRLGVLNLRSWQPGAAIRRERSLSVALERSLERLILVEGDPGVGKSIALRHVAHRMAEAAASSSQSNRKLPVYINLKELKRTPETPVDRELIRRLILQSMNRVNDKFIDEFLLAEFDNGIGDGLWVFLFDSFDEIPDVLSSTEQDKVINDYTSAISDFLSGMNSCRGVVASRYYRGPARLGWRTFRVLELSRPRQRLLMRRALPLKPELAEQLELDLLGAPDDVQVMARNPMLLQLLCDHVGEGRGFPSSAYDIFSKYLQHRFSRDEERTNAKFGFDGNELRRVAEQVAFVMTADASLGLSPLRAALPAALASHRFRISRPALYRALDALEYMKIARSDLMGASAADRQFTFSHRRFQEYFATCVVIKESSRVSAATLITDARWRETAVALCQTGEPAETQSLIDAATCVIEHADAQVRASLRTHPHLTEDVVLFEWPSGLLHVLGILQAGFVSGHGIPDSLRELSGQLLVTISRGRDLLDRKLALEVAGAADQAGLLIMVRFALLSDSQWLNDTAYKQIARLTSLPDDISVWVRSALLRLAVRGQLARNQTSINAHLSRLPNSGAELKSAARLATWIWPIDLALFSICSVVLGLVTYHVPVSRLPAIVVAAASFSIIHRRLYFTRWEIAISLTNPLIFWERCVAAIRGGFVDQPWYGGGMQDGRGGAFGWAAWGGSRVHRRAVWA